jgi:hypothetical protein
MHISKTVEMTVTEEEEVNAVLGNIVQSDNQDDENNDENGENGDDENGDVNAEASSENGGEAGAFYVVDPDTGELIDPVTGQPAEIDNSLEIGDDIVNVEEAVTQ